MFCLMFDIVIGKFPKDDGEQTTHSNYYLLFRNVAKFAEAYRKRTEILPDLNKRIK